MSEYYKAKRMNSEMWVEGKVVGLTIACSKTSAFYKGLDVKTLTKVVSEEVPQNVVLLNGGFYETPIMRVPFEIGRHSLDIRKDGSNDYEIRCHYHNIAAYPTCKNLTLNDLKDLRNALDWYIQKEEGLQ